MTKTPFEQGLERVRALDKIHHDRSNEVRALLKSRLITLEEIYLLLDKEDIHAGGIVVGLINKQRKENRNE